MKEIIFSVMFLFLFIYGCSNENEIQPDKPENTAMLMNHSLFFNDYDSFLALYSEGRRDSVTKELFDVLVQIKNESTGGANYRNYELVTFDNGKMLLIQLSHKREGRVEIENIIVVREEMQELFDLE